MAEWVKIEEHAGDKWELKQDDVVLGTIFYKPLKKKYSIWFSTPLVVAKVFSVATHSYQFPSLDEAKAAFEEKLREEILPFAAAVVSYCQ